MAVLSALRRTPGSLARNPVVFVPMFVLLALQVPQYALQSVSPTLSIFVSLGLSLVFLVSMPFFQAGIIGMADEALDGRTSLNTFVADGKSNYVSILVAYLAMLAINFVIGTIGFFAVVGGGIFFLDGGMESIPTSVFAVVAVVVALVALGYLLAVFFLQFYGQAIVIDDLGAVEGLKHSAGVVRRNLASTLGYTLLVMVLGGAAGLVFGLASAVASTGSTAVVSSGSLSGVGVPEPSLGIVVAGAAIVVAFGTALGGVFGVYSVAFYRAIDR
ncbi:DUF7847 domain-containing protein [Halorussus halobius]|uniref:DUF7847 domain-containing protein n=1 Tax=Halorussus halobius TaxID=1710537 RepID=UPI0010920F61|nr:hypothetical protein [Halorussus halobius]